MMNVLVPTCREGGSRWGRRFLDSIDSGGFRRVSFFIVAFWLSSNACPNARSLNGEGVEYPVKLAFLYNFAKFVEWPIGSYRNPGAPLSICIVGHDPFNPQIESELRTRTAWGHPVEVLTLKATDTLSVCHMVFVPVTEKDQADRIVSGLKGSSILTVGETEGFAERGGIINLTIEENKVHFEVNRLAADRAGLKISSKLLSLAKIVTEREHRRKS